jgi:outer membrane protein TolC
MKMLKAAFLSITLITLVRAIHADMPQRSITLEDYVTRAVEQGIQNRLNELALQTAGYTREIAFRQTDSPAFALNHTNMRGDTATNGLPELSNAQQTNLTMNETTPLGTTINTVGQWANSGGTLGSPDTLSRPGFTANITQPIYLFVKNSVLRTRKTADLTFANAKSSFQTTALTLRAQARNFYYTVMLDAESIKVDERKVASSQKLLEITQALVDAGKSAPIEIMRSKIQLQEDQRQLLNDQVLRDQAVLQAKNFAFLPLDADVSFVTELEFSPFKIPLPRLLDYAMLHNPNLESLRRSEELAHLQYQAALEPTRPTLSLNGTYNSNDQGTEPDVVAHGWTWTTTANWLFFDSFVTRDQTRNARIAEWVADLNLQDAERTTRVNIRSEYLDIKRTEKQIQDFTFSREQSKRNVDILRLRFQNGLTTLLDVLDAENQDRALDNEYLGLLVQFNQSKDSLSQQLGADVETLP